MNYFLCTCIFILSALNLLSQAPFQKVYTNTPYDQEGTDVVQMATGGFLIVGYSNTNVFTNSDAHIIVTDADGNKLSEQTFGGSKPDFLNRVLPLADGDIL